MAIEAEKKKFCATGGGGGGGAWLNVVATNNRALPPQSVFRRCLCIKHLRAECQRDFDETFRQFSHSSLAADSSAAITPNVTAEDAFAVLRRFFFMFNGKQDRDRFRMVCRYLVASINCEKPALSYMSILQKTESVAVWRRQVLLVLRICVRYLQPLNPVSG